MIADKDQTVTLTASCGLEIPVRIQVNPRARRIILRLDEKRRQAVAIAPSRRLAPEALRFARERLDWAAVRPSSACRNNSHQHKVTIVIPK